MKGYWNFEDDLTTGFKDYSGEGNNGAIDPLYASKVNGILSVTADDVLDKARIPTTSAMYNSGDLTVAVWAKSNDPWVFNQFLLCRYVWRFYMANEGITWSVGRMNDAVGPTFGVNAPNLPLSEWLHLVGQYHPDPVGGNGWIRFYVDGELIGETSIGSNVMWTKYGATTGIIFGNSNHGAALPVSSDFKDLKIDNRIWSALEVARDAKNHPFVTSEGQLESDNLNEVSFPVAPKWFYQLADNARNAIGSSVPTVTDVTFNGEAAYFNGTTSQIIDIPRIGDTSSTFALWVKPYEKIGRFAGRIYGSGGASRSGSLFGSWGGVQRFFYYIQQGNGVGINAVDTDLYELNKWYHLIGVADKENLTVRLYVNGALKASVPFDGTLTTGVATACIGYSMDSGNYYYEFECRDTVLFESAFNDAEANSLYKEQSMSVDSVSTREFIEAGHVGNLLSLNDLNVSFDSDIVHWTLGQWPSGTYHADDGIFWDAVEGHKKAGSLKVQKRPGANSQTFAHRKYLCTQGEQYVFAAWCKAPSGASSLVDLHDGVAWRNMFHSGSGEWERIYVVFTCQRSDDMQFRIGSYAGTSATVDCWFDDVELYHLPSASQEVINDILETGKAMKICNDKKIYVFDEIKEV